MFVGCSKLSVVKLHNGIDSIKSYAFYNCSNIKELELPSSIKSIEERAFEGCSLLEKFTIQSGIDYSPSILWDCPNLKKLIIEEAQKGFPIISKYTSRRWHSSQGGDVWEDTEIKSTIGSSYSFNGVTEEYGQHMTGLKELIIEDAVEAFSIKGFFSNELYPTPAFVNLDLDYFYVGRPLVDVENWSYWHYSYASNPYSEWSDLYLQYKDSVIVNVNDVKMGTGHIRKLEISGNCTINPFLYQSIDTLVLGKKIKEVDFKNIYATDLKKIVCYSITPPIVWHEDDIPTSTCTDAILYVPKGCRNAYSRASGWENFWNIVEESGDAGVENTADDGMGVVVSDGKIIVKGAEDRQVIEVYGINGQLMYKGIDTTIEMPTGGIYIVRIAGKVFKVAVNK